MILYFTPYDTSGNIADYYNSAASYAKDGDWLCFIDADTIFTTTRYGELIEKTIADNPEYEVFTAVTNRIGCKWQIAEDADADTDNIRYHRRFGAELAEKYGTSVTDCTDKSPWSGFFMLISKKAWNTINLGKRGMLGVDNDIFVQLRRNFRIARMDGLYLYHYYRGGNGADTSHLVRNTKAVYTCITGGYDTLIEPSYITKGWDYICFTDNPNLKSRTWQIRLIDKEGLSNVKAQRRVKILPHRYLPEYDMSLWVDANISIRGDLDKFVRGHRSALAVPKHPNRNCLYDEAVACVNYLKDTPANIMPQIERYRQEGFPRHYGLGETNILLRDHADCKKLMEDWWSELESGSHRDQLSFTYCLWKNGFRVDYLPTTTRRSEFFYLRAHNPQK